MIDVKRRKSVGSLSVLPFLGMLNAGLLWSLYGVVSDQIWPVTTTNFPLAVLGTYYANTFLLYAPEPTRLRGVVGLLAVFAVVATVAIVAVTHENSSAVEKALGMLGCAASVLLYAAPLVNTFNMLRSRSLEHVGLPLTLAIAATTSSWTIYAILADDVWICATNVIGLALACLQVAAFVSVRYNCLLPSNGIAVPASDMLCGSDDTDTALLAVQKAHAAETAGKGPSEMWPLAGMCPCYGNGGAGGGVYGTGRFELTCDIETPAEDRTAPPSGTPSPPRPENSDRFTERRRISPIYRLFPTAPGSGRRVAGEPGEEVGGTGGGGGDRVVLSSSPADGIAGPA